MPNTDELFKLGTNLKIPLMENILASFGRKSIQSLNGQNFQGSNRLLSQQISIQHTALQIKKKKKYSFALSKTDNQIKYEKLFSPKLNKAKYLVGPSKHR